MNCDSVSKLIPLYFYGELPPDEEDRVEQHLHDCADCARIVDGQRKLATALDRRQVEAPQFLLEDCRADLMAAIQGGAPRIERSAKSPWKLFLEAVGSTFSGFGKLRQPIGAVALVALGFVAARFSGSGPVGTVTGGGTPSDEVFATVRDVKPVSAGHVQIAYDEVRRRTVQGSTEDQGIQKLLLAAAHDENEAVRVESVGLLQGKSGGDVRDAFINAVAHDSNVGVRLKALEGLKPLSGDPEVRQTLAHVLLTDDSPAVRMQVVDLLVARRDGSMVGLLQSAVQREDNSSVRLKVEKALKDMNASIGTF
jgi:hypothetical protein